MAAQGSQEVPVQRGPSGPANIPEVLHENNIELKEAIVNEVPRQYIQHKLTGEALWLEHQPGCQWQLAFHAGYGFVHQRRQHETISKWIEFKQTVHDLDGKIFIKDRGTGQSIWLTEHASQKTLHTLELLHENRRFITNIYKLQVPMKDVTVFWPLAKLFRWWLPAPDYTGVFVGQRINSTLSSWLPKLLAAHQVPGEHLQRGMKGKAASSATLTSTFTTSSMSILAVFLMFSRLVLKQGLPVEEVWQPCEALIKNILSGDVELAMDVEVLKLYIDIDGDMLDIGEFKTHLIETGGVAGAFGKFLASTFPW